MNLADYDIDPKRGFLPNPDPITNLPQQFKAWDELGAAMPLLLADGKFRISLRNLPMLDSNQLNEGPELERAMMLLSMFANAYVNWGEKIKKSIPSNLAVALWKVAHRLGRQPISSHASIVLNNWKQIDTRRPLIPENLNTLQNFLGGKDEDWFFLSTAGVESAGGEAPKILIAAIDAIETDNSELLHKHLVRLSSAIEKMLVALNRMYEHCEPKLFFERIRPFLTGWEPKGVIYEGVDTKPKIFIGGSAAQSSLLQAIDSGLGIQHKSQASGPFLAEMRKYMPANHRTFLNQLDAAPSISKYVEKINDTLLLNTFNSCVSLLNTFRQKHLEMAITYISKQANDEKAATGTGGTEFVQFLSKAKSETDSSKIN